jgi:hypothetical protein
MVLMVGTYNPKTYEVLPLIQGAKANFDRRANNSVIASLSNIFYENNMQNK